MKRLCVLLLFVLVVYGTSDLQTDYYPGNNQCMLPSTLRGQCPLDPLSYLLGCKTGMSDLLDLSFSDFYVRLGEMKVVANMAFHECKDDLPTIGTKYECAGSSSAEIPTSAHKLRPGDIRVVSAVGDSVTAALGAKSSTIFTIATEYRGVSWSIGGDETLDSVTTVPNFIKRFNPDVLGWSIETGGPRSSKSYLNNAVVGAIAKDVPTQLVDLVEEMKADANIDYENDWKLLTLWIGGNDLCDVCKGNADNQPAYYIDYVRQSLDYLHNEAKVPRMFVNLVQILDVSRLNEVNGTICGIVHFVACSCGTTGGAADRERVRLAALEYQALTEELVNTGRYDTREDFTVVTQPLFINTHVPRQGNGNVDLSYFAPDCFHFSGKGQAASALALWNNMLQPVGQKSTQWNLGEDPLCPTEEQPYLFTALNSPQSSGGSCLDSNPTTSSRALPVSLAVAGCATLLALVAVVVGVARRRYRSNPERKPVVNA